MIAPIALCRAIGEPKRAKGGTLAEGNAEPEQDEVVADQRHRRTPDELDHYVPADLLNVAFPHAVRGYDRRAVDKYVTRVNRVIAETKMSASPRAAVRHALDQTQEQVAGLIERARETADAIISQARQEAETEADGIRTAAAELLVNTHAEAEATTNEAETVLATAKAEAEELVSSARADAEEILARARLQSEATTERARTEAEERGQELERELTAMQDAAATRVRELQVDTRSIWEQRAALLADVRARAQRLTDIADHAVERVSAEPDLVAALDPKQRDRAPAEEAKEQPATT
jgi:DivIVA domain-containing protein